MARPLKKCSKVGTLYTRPPAVESNIDGATAQDLPTLTRRAAERDRASPGYLTSECLVHLARDAIRRGDDAKHAALLPVLFERCLANLASTIPRSVPQAEQLREEVIGELAILFAEDASSESTREMDYFECRFDSALKVLRSDVIRREKKETRGQVPLPNGSDSSEDEGGHARNVGACRATQEDGLALLELLEGLPTDLRRVVVLCKVMGYKVESKDSSEITTATLCKVSGRTIQTRLNRVRTHLLQVSQEEA